MTKYIGAAAERLAQRKAQKDASFDLDDFLQKSRNNTAKLNLTVDWFVSELQAETFASDYILRTLAHELLGGIYREEAEKIAKNFVEDIKEKKSIYPASILNNWIISKNISIQMAETLAKEVTRLARENGLHLSEIDINLPPTEESGRYFQAAFLSEAVNQQRAEYIGALDELEKWFREWMQTRGNAVATKTAPELSHPLHDAVITKVPNDPASVLFSRMVTCPTVWQTNENECFKFAQDGKAIVIYRPDEDIPEYWNDFRERVLQTLESRFNSMKGELVADVADILFWHWLSNERPSYANITLAQILEYRGVKARPNVIEEHWQAMRDVRAIKLRGGGIESEALFHISAAQPNLWGTAEPPKLATVYRYHPGYFLSEAIQRDAFFLAYYARNIWQLDYYRDAGAKKLARVLRADWRRNAESYLPGGAPRYRTWRALLNDAGIDTESGEAVIHPTQFIKAIERELEKLYQNEFVRECTPAIYHPDDQTKRANLPRKGALMTWLSLRTHIAPAADITDALAQTATRRLARKTELKALAEAPKKSHKPRKKAIER